MEQNCVILKGTKQCHTKATFPFIQLKTQTHNILLKSRPL